MRRLIRDNQVGVLVNPIGFGWYTTHKNLDWLYQPELIELVESEVYTKEKKREVKLYLVKELLIKLGYSTTEEDNTQINPYIKGSSLQGKDIAGAIDLVVVWIPINTSFTITKVELEYTQEVILFFNELEWLTTWEN